MSLLFSEHSDNQHGLTQQEAAGVLILPLVSEKMCCEFGPNQSLRCGRCPQALPGLPCKCKGFYKSAGRLKFTVIVENYAQNTHEVSSYLHKLIKKHVQGPIHLNKSPGSAHGQLP